MMIQHYLICLDSDYSRPLTDMYSSRHIGLLTQSMFNAQIAKNGVTLGDVHFPVIVIGKLQYKKKIVNRDQFAH